MWIAKTCGLWVLVSIGLACADCVPAAELDPALVQQKIQALGVRDDLRPESEAYAWLWERRQDVVQPLIAGLQSTNIETARRCLRILDGVKPTRELEDALLQIAENPRHQLRGPVVLSLCRFSSEPRARGLLESNRTNTVLLPTPSDRATIAEALGYRNEAAVLLADMLATNTDTLVSFQLIDRLATNGAPLALSTLTRTSMNSHWKLATHAQLALAWADPAGHPLTTAQKRFLEDTGRRFKEGNENFNARTRELASLPWNEISPLVRRMLNTDEAAEATIICGFSHQTDILPEIKRGVSTARDPEPFIVAWLLLDDSQEPIDATLERIRTASDPENMIRTVARSEVPVARQLVLFRAVRHQLHMAAVVARGFHSVEHSSLFVTLFAEETDLVALGDYASTAAQHPKPEYDELVRRALEIAGNASTSEMTRCTFAITSILEAAAAQHLYSTNAVQLLERSEPQIAIAAARVVASGPDRNKAFVVLHHELANPKEETRRQAAQALGSIPCHDDTERHSREQAVLNLLDQPAEDYALRVLTTCAGSETVRRLEPRLDGTNMAAARYAAWVLAQSPATNTATKALRRLALHALFFHQSYQSGEGIDFEIAPHLMFHQDLGGFPVSAWDGDSTVSIPPDLMLPIELSSVEQTFLIRDYRDLLTNGRWGDNEYFFMFHYPHYLQTPAPDRTYISFFEVAAREDTELKVLYVRGQKVAHFPNRQIAAQQLTRLTGKPASYLSLTGESLHHDQVPMEPYRDQTRLLARFLLDRIESASLSQTRTTDPYWSPVNACNRSLEWLCSETELGFGASLLEALRKEAETRNMVPALKAAGLTFWR